MKRLRLQSILMSEGVRGNSGRLGELFGIFPILAILPILREFRLTKIALDPIGKIHNNTL